MPTESISHSGSSTQQSGDLARRIDAAVAAVPAELRAVQSAAVAAMPSGRPAWGAAASDDPIIAAAQARIAARPDSALALGSAEWRAEAEAAGNRWLRAHARGAARPAESRGAPGRGCGHCGEPRADGNVCFRCGGSLVPADHVFRPSPDGNAGGES